MNHIYLIRPILKCRGFKSQKYGMPVVETKVSEIWTIQNVETRNKSNQNVWTITSAGL